MKNMDNISPTLPITKKYTLNNIKNDKRTYRHRHLEYRLFH